MFVLVVVVLLVSVKMAPAWRSVTLSPFSTFTQGTVSHKAQGHTKDTVTCTCRVTQGTQSHRHHTKHTVTQAPYKVHKHTVTPYKVHLTQSTQSHRHHTKYTIIEGTVTHAHHHTRHSHTCTPSHKVQSHMHTITQGTKSHHHTKHRITQDTQVD